MSKGGAAPRRKGDAFERYVKSKLIKQGFFCARQPRSAFPDLIAVKKGDLGVAEIFFIECKVNKYISKEERAALKELSEKHGANAVVCFRKDRKIYFCDPEYKNQTRL